MEAKHLLDILTNKKQMGWSYATGDGFIKWKDLYQLLSYEVQRYDLEERNNFTNNKNKTKMKVTLELDGLDADQLQQILAIANGSAAAPAAKKKVVKAAPVEDDADDDDDLMGEDEEAAEETPKGTLEEAHTAAKAAIAAGKSAKLKAILTKFNAAKVTELNKKDYLAFTKAVLAIK